MLVPVTGGCQAPGAPTDFTAITRGDTVYLGWNDGNGGGPTTYVVHARYGPVTTGAGVIAALATARDRQPTMINAADPGGYHNVGGVPTGSYYVVSGGGDQRLRAPVRPRTKSWSTRRTTAPTVRTANAPSGRLPWFDVRQLVLRRARRRDRRQLSGTPGASNARARSGLASPGLPPIRTRRNPNHRAPEDPAQSATSISWSPTCASSTMRFGYNAKPTRANVNAIVAGDEIAYHWGSDAPEGSPNVVPHRHARRTLHVRAGSRWTSARSSPEYGRWTSAGAF